MVHQGLAPTTQHPGWTEENRIMLKLEEYLRMEKPDQVGDPGYPVNAKCCCGREWIVSEVGETAITNNVWGTWWQAEALSRSKEDGEKDPPVGTSVRYHLCARRYECKTNAHCSSPEVKRRICSPNVVMMLQKSNWCKKKEIYRKSFI